MECMNAGSHAHKGGRQRGGEPVEDLSPCAWIQTERCDDLKREVVGIDLTPDAGSVLVPKGNVRYFVSKDESELGAVLHRINEAGGNNDLVAVPNEGVGEFTLLDHKFWFYIDTPLAIRAEDL